VKNNGNIREYVEALKASRKFGPQVVCHRTIPARTGVYREIDQPLESSVLNGLSLQGIEHLYSHQSLAIEEIRKGNDIIVATPTASGKSLIYNIPVLESHLENSRAHALYLFPLKALAQDQQRSLVRLHADVFSGKGVEGNIFSAIYDGDTSPYQRSKLRKNTPPVLITNPEMLHLSLLPYHDSWSNFFRHLRYVVIDEVHTYRGLFGAHMSWVLRRLQRVARYYQSSLQFIMLSATIGNPEQLASKLIGRRPTLISATGAPSEKKNIVFINPWDSAAHTTAQLLEAALKRGLRTIVYTKSRKMTELITMWTKPRIGDLASKLSSYRAGFLPEERRKIEQGLSAGNLLGVISTSALELGIDIGNLDLCILVGYPGSVMATWQRSGRVGRGRHESATILVAAEDALDQHFMRTPEDFFTRKAENGALNPFNSRISRQHIHCAAAEMPLDKNEPLIQNSAEIQSEIAAMTTEAILYQEQSGTFWYSSRKRPQRRVDLRGGGVQLSVIHQERGEIIGEIDGARALKETHPGAIYLHHAATMIVNKLDLDAREVLVSDSKPTYYTRPTVEKQTEILQVYDTKTVKGCRASWGKVRVTEKVTGFQKVNNYTNKTISLQPLELPEQVMETEGLWIDMQEAQRKQVEGKQMHFMGAIHALEHGMIAMFPLLILCDRNDIGGISCPHHQQTDHASIFIYDGYAGGAGLAEEVYGVIESLLLQTEKTIALCGCELGCPSCVHSPKCGSGNRPIDKEASLYLVRKILQEDSSGIWGNEKNNRIRIKAGDPISRPSVIEEPVSEPVAGSAALPGKYCVFDLETKRSAEEVGGWSRAERMGISVGVVYDSELDGFVTYLEEEVDQLIAHLQRSDLVVGFNNRRFDYRVLAGYTDLDLYRLPTLDLLEQIQTRLGYRLSLNRLAEQTLGSKKSADGLQALKWFKEGKIEKIVHYCRKDVEITRNLLLYALENGHLLFQNKAGVTVRLPLNLDQEIIKVVQRQE
jgi:DEAD/DEAH box helicase domain-containing protein